MVGPRDRRDEVALDELVSYERDSERRPTTCWCKRCGEEYVVYSNRLTQYHLRFQVCSRCAAKEAARKFPTMSVREKMNGVKRWPVLH